METISFDREERIGTNAWLGFKKRYSRSMELIGYDVYKFKKGEQPVWVDLLQILGTWDGVLTTEVIAKEIKRLCDLKKIYLVYSSIIDGDIG